MTDIPLPVEQIRRFLCIGGDHHEQRWRIELWGVLGLLLGAAGTVEENERGTAARMVRSAYAALHLTSTYEEEMVSLFEGAMRSLPRPEPAVVFTPGEDAAFQGLATAIINLVWARNGEAAAADAWWRLYPWQTQPWRLSADEQARPALPN